VDDAVGMVGSPMKPIEGELTRIGLSPIVGLSGLCRAPVFGSTYAGGTIEELGAASLELTLLRHIRRPKHCPLHVPIRYWINHERVEIRS
jgi:hypothetical protein